MNTREIAAEYRLSHWAQIMRERSESGLSIKAYCENAGFHENVYYYWQRKLREAACERLTDHQSMTLAATGFAEIELREPTAQLALPDAVAAGQIRIEISGIKLSVDSTYPPDRLAALLRELVKVC